VFRVVIDTNVFVSYFWGGNPRKVVDLWIEDRFVLLFSPAIIEEIGETLLAVGVEEEKVVKLCEMILLKAKMIIPKRRLYIVQNDPADNKFLECAVDGRANYLVTGDSHLLKLKKIGRTKIMCPADFLKVSEFL
jgi:uncharacterized protein